MQIVSIILGAVCVALGLAMILFYRRGRIGARRCSAVITGFEDTSINSYKGVTSHALQVRLEYEGETVTVTTLDTFSSKRYMEQLRKRYIGRQVHVYYQPKKPYLTTIQELWWNNDIWGVLSILAGIFILAAAL